MSDARERIVFGVEIDQTPTGSAQRFEGGIETVCMAGDREALLLEKVANGVMGTMFLIGELGVGPDLDQAHR